MKRKSRFGIVMICMMVWLSTVCILPTLAAGNVVIPVKQVFTMGNAQHPTSVSRAFTYTLTADNTTYPMPTGSTGGVYTFTLTDSVEENIGPIMTYTTAGVYTYKLKQTVGTTPNYTYDPIEYDVLVYAVEQAGVLHTETVIKLAGVKYEKAEFNTAYNEVLPTPTPTPTPIPTPVPTPTPTVTPTTPSAGGTNLFRLPRTFDGTQLMFWTFALGTSLAMLVIIAMYIKKYKHSK